MREGVVKRARAALCATALCVVAVSAFAQDAPSIRPEEIQAGAKIYSQNCSPCHGARMMDPQGAFDLRTFPQDGYSRFVNSVTRGKNNMPPWGDLLKREEIDALWSYVVAGERK